MVFIFLPDAWICTLYSTPCILQGIGRQAFIAFYKLVFNLIILYENTKMPSLNINESCWFKEQFWSKVVNNKVITNKNQNIFKSLSSIKNKINSFIFYEIFNNYNQIKQSQYIFKVCFRSYKYFFFFLKSCISCLERKIKIVGFHNLLMILKPLLLPTNVIF